MKNHFIILCACLSLTACGTSTQGAAGTSLLETGLSIANILNQGSGSTAKEGLTSSEIGGAFKQALAIGTGNVVGQVGAANGFNDDSAIHIPLPKELETVNTMLATVGMSKAVDDLELKLNRAAESAAPVAQDLFLDAITKMSFTDIANIYSGPEDSATQYFKKAMTPELTKKMEPIIQNSLAEVGAVQAYDNVMGQYKNLPFVPDVKADLEAHVIGKGLDGIFHYMAVEEASIRSDPAKQTTALLKKVFGM